MKLSRYNSCEYESLIIFLMIGTSGTVIRVRHGSNFPTFSLVYLDVMQFDVCSMGLWKPVLVVHYWHGPAKLRFRISFNSIWYRTGLGLHEFLIAISCGYRERSENRTTWECFCSCLHKPNEIMKVICMTVIK